MAYVKVTPVVDRNIRRLCYKPYPGHPRGCPNFNKKDGCPPSAPMIDETLDLDQPVFAIYNVFNLHKHVAKMRARHPEWSDRQLRCCLYWQPRARKQLNKEILKFAFHGPNLHPLEIIVCPEAQGVNLTQTMLDVGIRLQWPPQTKTYQIVLAGTGKEKA